jgi:hypothetical protein
MSAAERVAEVLRRAAPPAGDASAAGHARDLLDAAADVLGHRDAAGLDDADPADRRLAVAYAVHCLIAREALRRE